MRGSAGVAHVRLGTRPRTWQCPMRGGAHHFQVLRERLWRRTVTNMADLCQIDIWLKLPCKGRAQGRAKHGCDFADRPRAPRVGGLTRGLRCHPPAQLGTSYVAFDRI
jgi:hypothetical protein